MAKTKTKSNPDKTEKPATSSGKTASQLRAESMVKAAAAFENFSLSGPRDPNAELKSIVPAKESVSAAQEREQINHLKNLDPSGRSLHVALPDAEFKKLLPSFDGKSLLLEELMAHIQGTMRSTEFYCFGEPTLIRISTQEKVDSIMTEIKKDQIN